MPATWYNTNWDYRIAVAVDCSAHAAGVAVKATVDVSAFNDFDHFFQNTESSGLDIYVVSGDGKTKLLYRFTTGDPWNQASRTGTLEFDFTTSGANAVELVYIYYGNSAAATGAGVPVNTNAVTGKVAQELPQYPSVDLLPQQPRRSQTRDYVSKHPSETIFVGGRVTDLVDRCESSRGLHSLEGIKYVSMQVLDQAGPTNQPSMYDNGEIRFVGCGGVADVVRLLLKAGTDGTDYGVELTIGTSLGRVLVRRTGLSVRKTTES